MAKTIKDYQAELRFVRMELNNVISEKNSTERELNHYRRFVRDKFEWFVEIHKENKHPNMTLMVIDFTKFFNRREPFDWSMLPRAF